MSALWVWSNASQLRRPPPPQAPRCPSHPSDLCPSLPTSTPPCLHLKTACVPLCLSPGSLVSLAHAFGREGENKKIHVGPLLPQSMPPKRKAKRDGESVLRKFFDEAMQIRSPLPPELIRARIPLIGLCGVGCRDAGARRARAS